MFLNSSNADMEIGKHAIKNIYKFILGWRKQTLLSVITVSIDIDMCGGYTYTFSFEITMATVALKFSFIS